MSGFTRALIVRDTGDGEYWVVHEGFDYHVGREASGVIVPVPEGTETDFASVPKLFRVLLPKSGRGNQAAVVHDVLYRRGFVCWRDESGAMGFIPIHRGDADAVFLEALHVLSVGRFRRLALYVGVRLGGWWGWGRGRVSRLIERNYIMQHCRVMPNA